MTLRRISALATQSDHDRIAVVDAALVAQKSREAAANPRLREIHRFHATDDAALQRMVNALTPGTYVRPHRHRNPPKDESFVLLTGSMGLVVFRDDGGFLREDCVVLSRERGVLAVDVRAGCWHAILALEPATTVFEVKPGPYTATDDKDFAPFSPADSDPQATAYLRCVEDRFRMLTDLGPRPW